MPTNISTTDIAVSGLRAQAVRMNCIANNIANAQTTDAGAGAPYRRKDVLLSSDDEMLVGVEVGDVVADTATDFQVLYDPGHPMANEDGYVTMPNVVVPKEMMNMMAATRAYQASVAVMKRFQDIQNATLEVLR
ncbi:MAG: flagellar basal body rod protein FlgC [Planctomycetes bacterium]|jgi:flagellar basal-body rod protein FlgC|nr:flagellar basal body rod protein FlgC [Phycisphaerae bacterium]NBB95051.1 flagellar basal body rod protein FlgC [Planctomycetota bacterium]